ncbi:MAG: universal stress protein [Pseudomonadota bacterium]
MTQQILCAVDLTDPEDAKELITESYKLATLYGARLSAVTVLPDYGSSWVGSFFKDGTLKEASVKALETLHELVDAAISEPHQVQCIVEIGTAYEEILHAQKTISADLIVMGAHKPDLPDRILGPNVSRVVRHGDASVMVLRV